MTLTATKKPAQQTRPRASAPGLFVDQSTTGVMEPAPEPDIVTGIFDLLCEKQPTLSEERATLEAAVRHHFKGMRATITEKPDATTQARRALALFNGRNAREVARRLKISRPHVYKLLKQAGE